MYCEMCGSYISCFYVDLEEWLCRSCFDKKMKLKTNKIYIRMTPTALKIKMQEAHVNSEHEYKQYLHKLLEINDTTDDFRLIVNDSFKIE